MSDEQSLQGKVAIVTGAGSGVGRAVAIALAADGVRSVLVGRRRQALEETARLLPPAGQETIVAPIDVADETAVNAVVGGTVEEFGGLDIVICAAAVGLYGPVEGYSLADWNQTFAANLTGVFLFSRAAVPAMRSRGGGAIVAIASGAGKQGYANLAAYSASKFGLIGFMQSLAAEVGGDGIKVSTVVPGSILTDFGSVTAEQKRAARDGRNYLEPEDVAAAICFLLRQPARAWTQELNLWPV